MDTGEFNAGGNPAIQYNTIQYNNLFPFPCEIRLQEIYIHIFFFYDKMLSNFEICI